MKMPEQDANAQAQAAAAAAAAAAAKPADGAGAAAEGAKPTGAEAEGGDKGGSAAPQAGDTLLGAKPGEAAKPGEEGAKPNAGAEPVIPEKYEIKPPEGMTVDQGLLDAVTPVFKELKLTQEGAQKLADAYAPHVAKVVEQAQTQAVGEFNKMVDGWKTETINILSKDGGKPEVELAHAARFIAKFGGTELQQVLNDTGLGNHPVLVKAIIAAGKTLANDNFPDSGHKEGTPPTPEEKAKKMFPSSAK
jgi:hypothetical protein